MPRDLWRREFVRNPYLTVSGKGSRRRLELPYFGLEINCNSRLLEIIKAFSMPRPLKTLREISPIEDELVMFLVHSFILLPANEIDWLARGLLHPADNPIGSSLSWAELNSGIARGSVAVFRVPIDFAEQSVFRARGGAQKIRETLYWLSRDPETKHATGDGREVIDFDLRKTLPLRNLQVFDLGDIAFDPGIEGLDEVGKRIGKVMRCVLSQKMFPIVLGGDHSLSFYVLQEIFAAHKNVGVIHFDAHSDLYLSPYAGLDRLNHANVFQFVRRCPELRVLLQIGVRDCYATPAEIVRVKDERIRYISALQMRHLTPEEVCKDLPRDIPYYISFDVDVLDPVYAPETGTPVPGGLDLYQCLALLDSIANTFKLVGVDFVEIGDSASPYHATAQIVARYMVALMINYFSANQLDNYVFERRSTN